MHLRYVIRNGEKVLQYSVWIYNPDTKKNEMYWQNVPLIEFKDE